MLFGGVISLIVPWYLYVEMQGSLVDALYAAAEKGDMSALNEILPYIEVTLIDSAPSNTVSLYA